VPTWDIGAVPPTDDDAGSGAAVQRLIGVYDADGTVLGELTYFVKARVGRAHCALCDITHGRVRERADWRACRDELPVPFETFHRDDQPDEVRAAVMPPAVVAVLDDGRVVSLADGDDLERCAGSPSRLVAHLLDAAAERRLRWAS
jgi:hypothetical protein